jgi:hypothetical protein
MNGISGLEGNDDARDQEQILMRDNVGRFLTALIANTSF